MPGMSRQKDKGVSHFGYICERLTEYSVMATPYNVLPVNIGTRSVFTTLQKTKESKTEPFVINVDHNS